MRTHLGNIIRSAVFLFLLVISLYYINEMLLPKYTLKNNLWPMTSSYNQFYQMEEDSVDVLFLGSSVVVNAFSPQEIYDTYGIRSYNLASEEQSIFLSYYWLKEALRYQNPQVVVLDTRFLFPQHLEGTNTIEPMTRKCLDPMKWSSVKAEAVNAVCEMDPVQSKLSYYLTNIRFHSRWTFLEEQDILLSQSQYSELKGFSPTMENGPETYTPYTPDGNEEAFVPPHQAMLEYLDRMVELCKEEGITLMLISLPGNTMNDGVNNMLTSYSQEKEVDFYNLDQKLWYDQIGAKLPEENAVGHDNLWGAIKISRFLGKLLQEEYHVPAVEDPQYEKTREFYQRFKENVALTRITDMAEYLQTIQKDRYTVFIAMRDEGTAGLTEPLKEELRAFGLQTDFSDKYGWSYCAVVSPETGVREEAVQGKLQLDGRFRDRRSDYNTLTDSPKDLSYGVPAGHTLPAPQKRIISKTGLKASLFFCLSTYTVLRGEDMKDKDGIVRIFSLHIREILERADLEFEKLQEIRLRAMGPLAIRYAGEEFFLKENGKIGREPEGAWMVTGREIQETMEFVGKYSLYAYEDELRQGFLTLRGGHRVGVAGRAVLEGDKVRSIRNISFLNVRLSHQIKGCADKALPFVCKGEEVRHTLIISPPRCGKTTLLRDLIRQISDGKGDRRGHTVGVVDERSEICGCFQGVPSNDVGIRTDVMDACPKAEGMMMMVRSMAPEVLAVDEIGRYEDIHAIETALFCGCRLIATVHGSSLGDIKSKPLFQRLMEEQVFERFLILCPGVPAGRIQEVLDGKGERLC